MRGFQAEVPFRFTYAAPEIYLNEYELESGLRYVLVYAFLNGSFPPQPDSPGDIALLRAANLALKRREKGCNDSFLFLVPGREESTRFVEAIEGYGFPGVSLVMLDVETDSGSLFFDEEETREAARCEVSRWLSQSHSAALPFPMGEYGAFNLWWSGIEQEDDRFDWLFSPARFAELLPDSHHAKANTWLSILGSVIDAHGLGASEEALGRTRASAYAACLCQWLNGFEAASGNQFNQFDANSAARELGIDPFFLGFEAHRLSFDSIDAFCDEHGTDPDEWIEPALKLITEDLRDELRAGLAAFFNGDAALFCALYWSIWPRLDLPMDEAMQELLGLEDSESFGELEAPWRFVQEGWCDAAYE